MGLAAFNAMRRAAEAAKAQAQAGAETRTDADAGNETETDFKKLTTDGLKAALTERGIAFDAKAKKADLLALLEAAETGDE